MKIITDCWAIANIFHCVVIALTNVNGDKYSSTVLPTHVPTSLIRSSAEFVILYCDGHYVRDELADNSPMPPIHPYWSPNADATVRGWDVMYRHRVEQWSQFYN